MANLRQNIKLNLPQINGPTIILNQEVVNNLIFTTRLSLDISFSSPTTVDIDPQKLKTLRCKTGTEKTNLSSQGKSIQILLKTQIITNFN